MELREQKEVLQGLLSSPELVRLDERLKKRSQESAVARFFSKVHKPSDEAGCWLWLGCKTTKGYGQLYKSGRMIRAHAFSYELHYGKVGNGMMVLHSCDNPSCVNPGHLFVGDQQSNMDDMVRKGRSPVGEKNVKAKLTAGQVIQIRNDTRSASKVASEFGVSECTIYVIRGKRSWKHI